MTAFNLMQAILDVCVKYDFPLNISKVFFSLRNNQDVWDTVKIKTNRYQHYGNDLLMDLIHASYFKNKKNFHPIFKYDFDYNIIEKNEPRLWLALHSNFSPLIGSLLSKNYNFAVVSDFPKTVARIVFFSGIESGNVEIISRNESCLLHIKKFLQNGFSVLSTIDFKSKMPGPFNLLSDSLFKFAILIQPKTFFGLSSVNDNGEIIFSIINLDLDQGVEKIKKDVMHFIANKNKNIKFQFGKFDYRLQKKIYNSSIS